MKEKIACTSHAATHTAEAQRHEMPRARSWYVELVWYVLIC